MISNSTKDPKVANFAEEMLKDGHKQNFFIFQVDDSNLAKDISEILNVTPGNLLIEKFSDDEISTQFQHAIRDKIVFLCCSTNTQENFFRLALSIDAAKRASAKQIIAVIPYFGYSRQDRRDGTRGPIGAKLMADMLSAAGLNKIISLDLHADQIQGFFDFPVDHIPGYHFFKGISKNKIFDNFDKKDWCICAPDAGGVKRADRFYKKFLKTEPDATFAMLSKHRDKPNSVEYMDLIGSVEGKNVIIVDDMVDTAGTLCKAAEVLLENGALSVSACITHGVLSGPATYRLSNSKLTKLFITNSIHQPSSGFLEEQCNIEILSNPQIYANVINSIVKGESVEDSLIKDL